MHDKVKQLSSLGSLEDSFPNLCSLWPSSPFSLVFRSSCQTDFFILGGFSSKYHRTVFTQRFKLIKYNNTYFPNSMFWISDTYCVGVLVGTREHWYSFWQHAQSLQELFINHWCLLWSNICGIVLYHCYRSFEACLSKQAIQSCLQRLFWCRGNYIITADASYFHHVTSHYS